MLEFLRGMEPELRSNVHPLGAGEHIAVNGVSDDGLVLAGQVFIERFDKFLNGVLVLLLRAFFRHVNSTFVREIPFGWPNMDSDAETDRGVGFPANDDR
jgi:hypothetical protein